MIKITTFLLSFTLIARAEYDTVETELCQQTLEVQANTAPYCNEIILQPANACLEDEGSIACSVKVAKASVICDLEDSEVTTTIENCNQ